ncbi:WXG100 family type VII secretion target [Kitasatospora cinereorecta]|uniref:WXG100 family type VII secretion target n=1 Tax=Kitasatospora cinereorecta TaxID=285560 RepID=A0ABW0VGB9_9ACTN
MGKAPLTPAEFKVDLEQLAEAIEIVRGRKDGIALNVEAIDSCFKAAESYWHSPAGSSFVTFHAEFSANMKQLNELLEEMVKRMGSAYQQYKEIEALNTANLQKR